MARGLGKGGNDLLRRAASISTEPAAVATDTAVSVATAESRVVAIEELAPHPLNPRGPISPTDRGIGEMATTIREVGILQPLMVARREVFLKARPALADQIGDAKYVVIAGHRRRIAATAAGLKQVPVVSGDQLLSDGLDLVVMVVENIQREDLTVVQEAEAFQTLVDDGTSQHTIAKRSGRSQPTVSRRLKLLRLPTAALRAIDKGTLAVKEAEILSGPTDPDLITQAWELVTGQGMAASVALATIEQQRKAEVELAAARAAANKQAKKEHLPLVEVPDDQDVFDLYPVFESYQTEALATARANGTLAGVITDDGLVYVNTAAPQEIVDTEHDLLVQQARAERQARDDRTKAESRQWKQAAKARREALARLTAKTPPPAELLDATVQYILDRALADELRLAAQLLGVEGFYMAWQRDLATATPAVRRRAAWAITLAAFERGLVNPNIPWAKHNDYFDTLTSAGYELTDLDRTRLTVADRDN